MIAMERFRDDVLYRVWKQITADAPTPEAVARAQADELLKNLRGIADTHMASDDYVFDEAGGVTLTSGQDPHNVLIQYRQAFSVLTGTRPLIWERATLRFLPAETVKEYLIAKLDAIDSLREHLSYLAHILGEDDGEMLGVSLVTPYPDPAPTGPSIPFSQG